jgi:uncharacterized membrane protein
MHWKELLKTAATYFLSGLLYTLPIAVTGYIIYQLFVFLDDIIPIDIPGLGLLSLVIVVTGIGILGSSFLLRPINRYFEGLINGVPLVKTIYRSIKEVLSAFVGDKKRFTKPVLVQFNQQGMEKMGFITSEDLSSLGIAEGKIAVYLPHSINFSGNLFIVSRDLVTPLEANSAEVMKFIVSGGVIDVESKDQIE